MSAETTTERPTYVLARAEVRAVNRVSPSFVRVTFGGDELFEFGTPGEVFDSRIKLIFPPASGVLPTLDRENGDWWGSFLAVPEEERGSMRTYSVRSLRADEATGTEVDVDFVLHLEPGLTGPASRWASAAAVGQELYLVGPRRGVDADAHGGAEYAPGTAASVLLAGDETAAPAIARILEDAPSDLRGVAFIEVPSPADILRIDVPSGVEVHWLPRDAGEPHGLRLIPAVLAHLGDADAADEIRVKDIDTEDLLWETPDYSGLGEEIAAADAPAERYFWIAGESGVVTTLRRHLVKDLGIDRSQVAFMGYWRRGVAMRG
ncbi:siderophore-interacting protein [Microbacterium saperdae]|uniref:NADPH-dependent ferric siderophore reductase n=1 Tax=Microbacterium saperdae TaxID=69368 RepID=A0A543BBE8_9MICO|nr:siderophore-interacting protein [Microbacterium saperdae]TQL82180.1 NADPH-dependent ferric siderophore reductase [Microbacterium saperdae]GGM37800.1 siderophore-interacting protein [Microbacterium saperdae]